MNLLFPGTSSSRFGGKGAALAKLGEAGFDVPAWFAVPPEATWETGDLTNALAQVGEGPFAVRSSATMEDGAGHSFAGQFETFLEVPASEVEQRIRDVRDSSKREAVLTYCRERGLPLPEPPTVLVQRMIQPRCAGVAFSADPVSGQRSVAVVSAVEGTGEKLVSGEVDGEDWRIGSGTASSPGKLLSESEARGIATLAKRCEKHFGRPQDIEWAIDRAGKLWLLQSRPITTLANQADPDDTLRVWDNSNIAESYGGVTTPLTFSFARRIYESVYREFCRLMSVPAERIERSDDVFPQMLGLIRGRTYYNLASWYRVLALLPGFQLNRSFMEQMMGVKEPLPESLVQKIIAESTVSRSADMRALVGTCLGLLRQLRGLDKQIASFQVRLDRALAPPLVPLAQMSGEDLVSHYRDLERKLLKRWDAPLVNDFFAMIFYGVLRSLCTKWAGDNSGTLQNDLLADTGGIISAEPPRRIIRMAKLAKESPGLPALLASPETPEKEKLAALSRHPELSKEFQRYLDEFGDRCLEELKLESPTVRDDATTLLASIGALALRQQLPEESRTEPTKPPAIGNPLKSGIFSYVLRQARERVRSRENLRFERTRLFGRVRSILRELGKRLHADGQLESADDIFYLELGEVLATWEATGTILKLGDLAAQRRAEFAIYQNETPPPDRFETHGPVHRYTVFEETRKQEEAAGNTEGIKGIGACPGKVTGRVRVVLDPRGARLEPREILVALQTDPGWVVLFPAASGLLVERGSLLSHSAIVSRELRLPCIVSLPRITTTLKTGDLVEMDGSTGSVRILESPATSLS
ncbi:PEP/pyruvate-binding domain-containing protein [Luteolibacter luteus]|uniref:Phosphoenolpyruvate synthase n=1 Tax=Luteolibacter luteus TaxID=2728835 RepID=A0A858RD63_9BACT|nr:PEP/pyruvate-binding domain-containing protein [Luteolibacter luteus]QJE94581.1 phosphoenolpyruvate synthase [Luteolibacter luteus]